MVYLDDILIFSEIKLDHIKHIKWVLQKLREHVLFAKPRKCQFVIAQVGYLGHIIANGQLMTNTTKTATVADWPEPTTIKELQ